MRPSIISFLNKIKKIKIKIKKHQFKPSYIIAGNFFKNQMLISKKRINKRITYTDRVPMESQGKTYTEEVVEL